jgi:hypothetical protein
MISAACQEVVATRDFVLPFGIVAASKITIEHVNANSVMFHLFMYVFIDCYY